MEILIDIGRPVISDFYVDDAVIEVGFDICMPGAISVPEYDGPYTVTPDIEEQILLTNGKKMTDDVTVEQVPYFELTGKSGGKVCNIGG